MSNRAVAYVATGNVDNAGGVSEKAKQKRSGHIRNCVRRIRACEVLSAQWIGVCEAVEDLKIQVRFVKSFLDVFSKFSQSN